jgi:polyisoprenoid-binding protein YceI
MKNLLTLVFVLTFGSVLVASNGSPVQNIDITKSTVVWSGYKVTGSHQGTISVKSGSLKFDEGLLTGGSVVIDMTTINCTDLQAGKGKESLEGHLKSDDFFGVAQFPTANMIISKVVSRGKEGEYKITALLTIKNTTKEIKFDAVVINGTATAKVKVDRTDFDVRYGSGSFFDSLGDKTIYDEFDLDIKLTY